MSYKIIPIDVGTLMCSRGVHTYMAHMDQIMEEFRHIAWYITGGEEDIIVDTGPGDTKIFNERHWPTQRTPEQEPERAFQLAGVDFAKVKHVILTHLHPNKCGNNHLFPNAKFYVQRSELQSAIAPVFACQMEGYECLEMGLRNEFFMNTTYTVLDGDYTPCPGVEIIHTPGHTPGSQCVSVDTGKGKFIITGDVVPLRENWDGGPWYSPHIPNTIHTDLMAYQLSFKRLEGLGGTILPGCEVSIFDQPCYPAP